MVQFNPFAPDVQYNPYPTYRQLRDEAPVHYNPDFKFYALSRYEDVLNAFLDPATFVSGQGVTIDGADAGSGRMIGMDPPEHTRVRKLFSRLFTPRRMAELEPFIRGIAAKYLDEAVERGSVDIVQDFSLQLPLEVIGELLGIPPDMRRAIHSLSNRTVMRDPDPTKGLADARAAMGEMMGLYLDLVRERRRNPREDIISMICGTEVTDDDGTVHYLPDELIANQFILLGSAGHETVMKLIGNGAVALWWYPDQRRELVADPGLIPNAVEEMVRWDNPAPLEGRVAVRDVTLHGTTIPAGSRVMLLMGAANHDERQYEEPELFSIHRSFERPLGFGFGIHLCLGAGLARLEMKVAFEELLARFPEYEIDESKVDRGPAAFFRGLQRLPIVMSN